MALADPQSVTISAVPVSLPRTGMASSEGTFQDASGQVNLSVRHQSAKRTRHVIMLKKSVIVADPLVPTVNQNLSYSASIAIDLPRNGIAVADAIALANALVVWATSATLTKVAGGES